MTEALLIARDQLLASGGWELAAAVLAVLYLALVIRENIWCWYAAFVSTSIFLVIFWQVRLYMESGLQVFYLVMAVYGWWQWKHGGGPGASELPITTWSWRQHLLTIAGITLAALTTGWLLSGTDARLPYIDSFTTWASVVTTYMVARKVLENWIYWFVIDAVSIALYIDRGLYYTAILFALYVVMVVFGGLAWYRRWTAQTT
ncbi:MAG: nicotinamide mononucleotide transporter [Gammaproteobacteria bacterium]|nr:nicotinamide mononucleotide transporter [Gammaproteobacteria bacterium]